MGRYNFAAFPVTPVWVQPVTTPVHADHAIWHGSGVVLADGRVLHVWQEIKTSATRSGHLLLGYAASISDYLTTNGSVTFDRILASNTDTRTDRQSLSGNVCRGPDGALWLLHFSAGGENTGDWAGFVTYDASMAAPPDPYTSRSMIWRSTDEGATWVYTAHMPQPSDAIGKRPGLFSRSASMGGIEEIPVGFPNAGRWLATVASGHNQLGVTRWGGGIYSSDDQGATWTRRLHTASGGSGNYMAAGSYGFGSDGQIYTRSFRNNTVGANNFWHRSADGAATWNEYQAVYSTPSPPDENTGGGPWLTTESSDRLVGIASHVTAADLRMREHDLGAVATPLWNEAGTLPGADTYSSLWDTGLDDDDDGLLLRHLDSTHAGLWAGDKVLGIDTIPDSPVIVCGVGVNAYREPIDPVMFQGISAREESIVVEVLDLNRNVIGRVTPSADSPPRLSVNGLNRFTRTLTGLTLDAADSAALNPASDRLAPSWVINGTRYPLGVFLIGDDRRYQSSRPLITQKGWVDEQQIVAQRTETTLSLGAGTAIGPTLEAILGALLPNVQVDATSATLTDPVAWPAGTDRHEIIASLCSSAGFLPPFTDNQGTYRCVTAPDLETVAPTLIYPDGSVILDDSRTEADAWLDTPNRYVVINTGATAGSVVGVFDVPSSAPYSIAARGFPVTEVIEQQGVVDFVAAQSAARAAYVAASSQFTTGFFDTPMVPLHDVWNVVQIGVAALWLEVGWSVTVMAGAVQQHQLRRIYR